LTAKQLVNNGGGIENVFDITGNLSQNTIAKEIINIITTSYRELKKYFIHRDALERYLNSSDVWLMSIFNKCLHKSLSSDIKTNIVDRFV